MNEADTHWQLSEIMSVDALLPLESLEGRRRMQIERSAILVLCLLFMVERSLSSPVKVNKTKVLILGAGLSGITAAKTLLDKGITDFLILEGKNYTGGRIHSVPFAGLNIEAGANWIHFAGDEDTAPIVKLRDAKNINGTRSNYSDFIIRDEKGNVITDLSVSKDYDDKVGGRAEDYIEARKEKKLPDIPARVGLQLLGWKAKRPIEKVVEYFNIDFEFAKRPELVSFYNFYEHEGDFLVTDQRGFWSMYDYLYKPLANRILLDKTVTEIKYSATSVEISTSDGQKFAADYALCTFSNGVLASDMVTFSPPLPDWKKEVIFKNPMSVYTKIFLKFPSKFWDDHEYILHASEERSRFPVFMDLERPGFLPNGSNVLLVTVTEDEGKRIEQQTYNETKAEVMKVMRKIYGQGIPDATAIYYYRWSQDPFTQGSYSDSIVGFTSEDFNKLGQNLGRLYFSGEATSEVWYGYIQGAYLSGEEKGKMIACQIHPDDSECKVPEKKKPKNQATFLASSAPGVLLLSLLCSRLWM
ncbi:uncharacterized protein LOC144632113 [Oculina patagonica]